ncbi:Gfo/Idh/MocA family protein [Phycisphaerales bacterium AB-hyl4]|uniref:Gfo/Idh/MocA family protein n=1 Tax=Natronomicrosphaera hydrolytica TaxID=3242702 RepID=A0ABV4U4E0_9BACT
MKTIRFGIIGCGLMGKEFASAAARWCHLIDAPARPELVAICNRSDKPFAWFTENFPTIKQVTHDYKELLANKDVDAVYIALPHDMHEQAYIDAIKAGKHLMGEKPFGIDRKANEAINAVIAQHPDVFVRCVSQFPFFPAVQQIGGMTDRGELGRIIEVQTGFLHSSDLDVNKPINWKRQIATNGAYGVMGDLGMHACHVPLRAGWRPLNVRAVLNNLVTERYEAKGSSKKVPCETWDNATLLIEAEQPDTRDRFPWTLRTHRIAPGEKNSWYVEVLGTQGCVRFNTRNPRQLERLQYTGGEQTWQHVQTGFDTAYPTITGGIFEFGFTDAMQQMWAAYLHEMVTGETPTRFAGCVRPEEAAISHAIFDAALHSAEDQQTAPIRQP